MVDFYNQFRDFKSFEATFFDKNRELHKLTCSIKSIEGKRIILSANNQKNNDVIAHKKATLKLYIYTENGVYSASSRIIHVAKGLFNTEYIITYPKDSKHSQRREYYRADIPVEFKLKLLLNKETLESQIIQAKVKNICGKGMCFVSDTLLPDHSSAEIELFFKEKRIKTHTQHVYTKQIQTMNRTKYTHAFTFNTINGKDLEFIVKKCFLYQLKLIKNGKI